ncbi:MAG: hypothetical protein FWD27_01200 [Coriobacteriia bacterium]|nr:hypothetical protein [Coriobacteriia bacterium]
MNDTREIPTWLAELLPQPKQPTRVFLSDKGLICAKHPDNSVSTFDANLEEAYDMLKGGGADIVFADEVYQHYSQHKEGVIDKEFGAIWIPVNDGKAFRMLTSTTDDDRYSLLKWAWEEFQEIDAKWRENAGFYNSWHWLDTHPAFWTRSYRYWSDDPKWQESMLWGWETEGYCQKIYVSAMQADDGRVAVALELGAHVSSCDKYLEMQKETIVVTDVYQEHYHDYRLDSFAPTYEEAIILAAKSVDRFFHTDGNERLGVPYEPTEIEKELALRMEEADDCFGHSHNDWRAALPRVAFENYGNWLKESIAE